MPLQHRKPYLLLPGMVNGRRAGSFLLDTGSALNAIGIGLANRLELPKRPGGVAIGIAGREPFHYRLIDRWRLNGLALPTAKLAGLNLARINRAAPLRISGVVGYPALRRVPFTLDAAKAELILYNPRTFKAPEKAKRVQLHEYSHLPVIRATLSHDRRIWLLLDSGSDGMVTLPKSVKQRWPGITAVPQTGTGESVGVGGSRRSTRTWIEALELFGLTLRNLPVAFEPMDDSMRYRGRPVGRAGLKLLTHFRLTFHREQRALWVEWRPNAGHKSSK
jgi:hypothetical protein